MLVKQVSKPPKNPPWPWVVFTIFSPGRFELALGFAALQEPCVSPCVTHNSSVRRIPKTTEETPRTYRKSSCSRDFAGDGMQEDSVDSVDSVDLQLNIDFGQLLNMLFGHVPTAMFDCTQILHRYTLWNPASAFVFASLCAQAMASDTYQLRPWHKKKLNSLWLASSCIPFKGSSTWQLRKMEHRTHRTARGHSKMQRRFEISQRSCSQPRPPGAVVVAMARSRSPHKNGPVQPVTVEEELEGWGMR